MARAEEKARRQGLAELHLHTNARMVESQAFHACLGYQAFAREPFKGSALDHLRKTTALGG